LGSSPPYEEVTTSADHQSIEDDTTFQVLHREMDKEKKKKTLEKRGDNFLPPLKPPTVE
jgi:hypothetical protein